MSPRAMNDRTASTPASYAGRSRLERKRSRAGSSAVAAGSATARPADSLANLGQPPIEPADVAVDRPTAEPGRAGPPVPGDDPVVEGEAEQRQALVVGAIVGSRSSAWPRS